MRKVIDNETEKVMEFDDYEGKELIEHLDNQRGNTDDTEDNLISVYLTETELNYIIRMLKLSLNNETIEISIRGIENGKKLYN